MSVDLADIANLKHRTDSSQPLQGTEPASTPGGEQVQQEQQQGEQVSHDPFDYGLNARLIDWYTVPNPDYSEEGVDESCPVCINEEFLVSDCINSACSGTDNNNNSSSSSSSENAASEETDKDMLEEHTKQYGKAIERYEGMLRDGLPNIKMEALQFLLRFFPTRELETAAAFQDVSASEGTGGGLLSSVYNAGYASHRKERTYTSARSILGRLLKSAKDNSIANDAMSQELSQLAPNFYVALRKEVPRGKEFSQLAAPNYIVTLRKEVTRGQEHAKITFFGPKTSLRFSSTVSPASANITIPRQKRRPAHGKVTLAATKRPREEQQDKDAQKQAKEKASGKGKERERPQQGTEVVAVGVRQVSMLWLSSVASALSERLFSVVAQQVQENSRITAGVSALAKRSYVRFERRDKVAVSSYVVPDAAFSVERLTGPHLYKSGSSPEAALLSDGQCSHRRRGVDTDFLLAAVAEEQLLGMMRQMRQGVLTSTGEPPSVLGALSAVVTHKKAVEKLRRFFDVLLAGKKRTKMTVHWKRTVLAPYPTTEFVMIHKPAMFVFIAAVAGSDCVRCVARFSDEVLAKLSCKRSTYMIVPELLEYKLDSFMDAISSDSFFEQFKKVEEKPQTKAPLTDTIN